MIFRSGKQNEKADALTRRADSASKNDEDERRKYQHCTLLTSDRVEVVDLEEADPDEPLYTRVIRLNKSDEFCSEVRKALIEGKTILKGKILANCEVRDGALFRKEALWVPSNNDLLVELIREVHDQPAVGHPGIRRTVEQIGRQFYWPAMRKTVDHYVRNCYTCQRSKAPRDKSNGLLQPLELPEQRWPDIAMDFVTGLPLSNGFNAILTVIYKLTKERHYIPCSTEEGTTTEATVELLINWVFRTHGLPSSIVSDRGPQFISVGSHVDLPYYVVEAAEPH